MWPVATGNGNGDAAPTAEVTSLAVSSTGEIYLAGRYTGAPDFGAGALPSAAPNTQVFLAKFDPQGNPAWARDFNGLRADVRVDDAGRPILAATVILETRSGGSGILRQIDPSSGQVQWEYPYSWPAGYYAEHVALEAAGTAVLGIPGSVVSLGSQGQVLWTAVLTASGEGDPGYPMQIAKSSGGSSMVFLTDYVTWSPMLYHYRLLSLDAQGRARWTRPLQAEINQKLQMVGDPSGNAVIFGTAYGNITFDESRPLFLADPKEYLAIVDGSGQLLAQCAADTSIAAATWVDGKIVTVRAVPLDGDVPALMKSAYALGFADLGAAGEVVGHPVLLNPPELTNPTVLLAAQGSRILVAGTRDNRWCADCGDDFQPRPYLVRLTAAKTLDQSFGQLMP